MATAHHFVPYPNKTYATVENAVKAVNRVFPQCDHFGSADLHYVVMTDHLTCRFYPLFIGERALRHGAHHHFAVCA